MIGVWVARKAQGPEDWNQPHKTEADKGGSEVSSTSSTAQACRRPLLSQQRAGNQSASSVGEAGPQGSQSVVGWGVMRRQELEMQVSSLLPEPMRAERWPEGNRNEECFPCPPHFIDTKDFFVSILDSTAIYGVPTTWQAVAGVWDKSVNKTDKHLCHGDVFILVGQWKSLGHVWLLAAPWTIQLMEFSRPEYWSG